MRICTGPAQALLHWRAQGAFSSMLWHGSAAIAAPAAAPAAAAVLLDRRAVGHFMKHGVANAGSSASGGGVFPKLNWQEKSS